MNSHMNQLNGLTRIQMGLETITPGLEGDDCVDVAGTSNKDGLFGCLDSDGDGWADTMDDLPSDPLQHIDADGDGIGDSISSSDFDMCPETTPEERPMVDSSGWAIRERWGLRLIHR